MSIKVGQILYVVPSKRPIVYPVQVVEELTKKTLTGVVTEFIIRTGGDNPQDINLKEVVGEYFESSEKVKSELTTRAINSVAKMVEVAEFNAAKWYQVAKEDDSSLTQTDIEDDDVYTKLPDGTIAKVNVNNSQ